MLEAKARNSSLDVIRGIALCLVIVWHYGANRVQAFAELPELFAHIVRLGWTGVDLFFVASGFLIAGNLFDAIQSPRALRTFYIRRACRILPLYFLSTALFSILSQGVWWRGNDELVWLFTGGAQITPLAYASFTQNFFMIKTNCFGPNWLGITWSLVIETQFYLIIPFAILYLPRRLIPILTLVGILFAPFCRFLLLRLMHLPPIAGYVLLPCQTDALFIGVFIAWLGRNPLPLSGTLKSQFFVTILFVISTISLGYIVIQGWQIFEPNMSIIGYTIFDIFYGFLIWFAARSRSWVRIPLGSSLRWLGIRCYSVYLFHQPVIGLLHAAASRILVLNNSVQQLAISALAFALTTVLAGLSWHYLERPLIRIGHKLTAQTRAQPHTRELSAEST